MTAAVDQTARRAQIVDDQRFLDGAFFVLEEDR